MQTVSVQLNPVVLPQESESKNGKENIDKYKVMVIFQCELRVYSLFIIFTRVYSGTI